VKYRKILSFLAIGSISSMSSLGANYILLRYFKTPLQVTYFAVYSLSIATSYHFNSRYTFKAKKTNKRLALYYGTYISSMGIGLLLLTILRATLTLPNWYLPFFVFPFTTLWNYSWSKHLMSNSKRPQDKGPIK
jgi:putative flippase GtrA